MPLRFVVVAFDKNEIRATRYLAEGVQEARVTLRSDLGDGIDAGLRSMRSAIRQVLPLDGGITAVGVSTPGVLDYKHGVLRSLPGFPDWVDVPLQDALVESLGVPVFVARAADTAVLGEWRFGVGRGVSDLVYITVNDILGAGMVFQDQLFTGGNGMGGEVGKLLVECSLVPSEGKVMTLEKLFSTEAILEYARAQLEAGASAALMEGLGHNPMALTVERLCDAARLGDPLARSLLKDVGACLGMALIHMMYLFDPALFVLDGMVQYAGDVLLSPMRQTLAARTPAAYRDHARIVLAQLGNDVRLWGALALCLAELGL
ncbi:MAG: ROK family protein [Anaerolineae bacterium]|nr:ROK family protein [Anaerolineae bacterium]